MHPKLLEVVCCPLCRHRLDVREASRTVVGGVLEGVLQCTGGGHSFPVTGGVPDLLPGTQHASTASAFSFQWRLSFRGWFERTTRYGYDVSGLVDWVFANCFGPVMPEDWLLDAGCGRGDKTIDIARRYPRAHVIGLDLTDTLHLSRQSAAALGNVHFIRGDLLRPPICDGVVAKALSWGVLHHTPDTAAAFRCLARMLSASGELATWLYPHPSDSDIFDMAYEMRDVHFLGRGHRLPKPLLLAVLPVYLVLTAPYFLLRYGNPLRDARVVRTYVKLDELPLLDKIRAALFIYLDNLVPEFQDRPRRALVNQWYAESGFGPVAWIDPGLFWATRRTAS